MEKDKIILIASLIISILLFFYSLSAIFHPEKIKERHEKSLKNSSSIFGKYALKQSKKSRNNRSLKFTGFVALIMSILMICLFVNKLFFK